MKKNAIIYAVAILICGACTNSSKTIATEKPTLKDYKIGEKWTWYWKRSVGDTIRGQGETYQEVVKFNNSLGFSTGVDTVQISTILNKKQSSTPWRDWPLKVGKKWKYEETWESNDGTQGTTRQDVEIISFEEVTVAAGKFMAYKMEYVGRVTNLSGYDEIWEDIWWYAPAIKKYIKHTQDDGQQLYVKELIDYTNPQ